MNERLKELVKQSGGEFWQRLENDMVKQDAYITFDPPDRLEKFAELLVRECAEIARHNVMNISTYSDAEFVSDLIHQHFGVK